MLLNAPKCQGCNFYCFWVIKEKPIGEGEGVKLPTLVYIEKILVKLNLN